MKKDKFEIWKYALAFQNNGPNYFAITIGKWGAPSIAHAFDEATACLIATTPNLLTELSQSTEVMQNALKAMDICKWETVHQVALKMQIETNKKIIAQAISKKGDDWIKDYSWGLKENKK